MLVEDMIKNIIALAPSSHSIVLNMREDNDPVSRLEAQSKLIRLINEGLRELSIKFALSQGSIDIPYQPSIFIRDPKFIEIMEVYSNGDVVGLREFRNQNNKSWYRMAGLTTVLLSPDLANTHITINYATLIGSVSKLDDEIPLLEVFNKALECYVLMKMSSNPATQNQADDTRGMTYKNWMDALEELEALGYRRADLFISSRTNDDKGWLEW